ncbi:Hint domain-containing protein [Lutimaribacter pacificus]|uniref:Hint domain-containing protein n=1 Tax=Lutimaribacter pacificus TaxID=391948 RepID=A0A1H0GQI7_9RHOB|nr:Hint domain-containing protein [Lutimaribacter pacificus]SDO09165.1 Hint domain-containing protein [Lutimaribacter pacificus]SHJ90558.1 Hint domain-containing protein [Lutimaribacter pacificus]
MAFSIFAAGNKFATATGANINSGGNTSGFDYPLSAWQGLVITAKDGDADPRRFDIGDTYDLRLEGADGTLSIANATVIRSDAPPPADGCGAVMFEGQDQDGNPVQVIWTPGFDIDGWYSDNFVGSTPPRFYSTDQDAAYTHEFVCFAAETRIDTPLGARVVADIRPGDAVTTVDHGARPVAWVGQRSVAGRGANAPVEIAAGVLGNTAPLRLSQQHMVLWRSARAELLFAAPEVLIPVRALIDGRAVRLRPCARVTYVHLMLADHELLLAEGAACESLMHVPPWVTPDGPERTPQRTARPVLTYREACILTGAGALRHGARLAML